MTKRNITLALNILIIAVSVACIGLASRPTTGWPCAAG